ncbi:hypothetical protein K7X08_035568 [Anisodus acutangulus]|uniref:Uncharacterized protein n=1 Tax=Anisodus acutangulus TaxID=402998 RepID=A0A9Q1R406_9SOLA|nr:hypothetical protein K7X08_035568 [Anisodus acutangulus]
MKEEFSIEGRPSCIEAAMAIEGEFGCIDGEIVEVMKKSCDNEKGINNEIKQLQKAINNEEMKVMEIKQLENKGEKRKRATALVLRRNNDMVNEGQSIRFEGIQEMLQTYMERESRLEEERKILLQSILANDKALKRANKFFEEVNSSNVMDLFTPQYRLVEEETSSPRDEPKYFYGHDESRGNEEVVQIEEEQNCEEEVFSSQKDEIEEMLSSIIGRNAIFGQVLTKSWKKFQHKNNEIVQNMDFTVNGLLQALNELRHQKTLDKVDIVNQD